MTTTGSSNRAFKAFARFAGELGRKAGLLGEDERIPTLVDHGPLLEKAFAERAGIGWDREALERHRPARKFLVLPRRASLPGRAATRRSAPEPLRNLLALHRRLPHRRDRRALRGGQSALHLLPHHRTPGPIPRELRRKMGNRIFGCDDCQDVCPWNRFAVKATDSELAPRADGLGTETLADLLALTRDEFQRRTRRSAIRRAGYPGFLRNVVVALGNTRDPDTFPPLVRALDHPEPLVRGHAAWALAEVDASRATPLLRARLRRETDDSVREEITATLDERAMVHSPKTMVKTAN